MVGATWSIGLGILVFIIAIVFATYYYLRYKKFFLVLFVASVSIYIFAVFYTWDVYDSNKNIIMIMLVISTIIMLFLGKYFSKFKLKANKLHTSLKEKE
ncbi:MAG: hypothetical protein PF569_05195 [Candidatus Woesearchaeota archaeon]|jgi:hypothetical protein|nr:hypothetical protein [Candidatus Woesearchaeota archaeon]